MFPSSQSVIDCCSLVVITLDLQEEWISMEYVEQFPSSQSVILIDCCNLLILHLI